MTFEVRIRLKSNLPANRAIGSAQWRQYKILHHQKTRQSSLLNKVRAIHQTHIQIDCVSFHVVQISSHGRVAAMLRRHPQQHCHGIKECWHHTGLKDSPVHEQAFDWPPWRTKTVKRRVSSPSHTVLNRCNSLPRSVVGARLYFRAKSYVYRSIEQMLPSINKRCGIDRTSTVASRQKTD